MEQKEVIFAVILNYSLKMNFMNKLTLKQILRQKNRCRFGEIINLAQKLQQNNGQFLALVQGKYLFD